MAWNKYYIIVKSPKLTDTKEILVKLNLEQYKPTEQVPLHYSNKPETLFTGFYNDSFKATAKSMNAATCSSNSGILPCLHSLIYTTPATGTNTQQRLKIRS